MENVMSIKNVSKVGVSSERESTQPGQTYKAKIGKQVISDKIIQSDKNENGTNDGNRFSAVAAIRNVIFIVNIIFGSLNLFETQN